MHDNRDVIIADFYSESNEHYLLAAGQPGQPPGRITIGASKVSPKDQEAITIDNYAGRIFIGGGDAWWQAKTEEPLRLKHTGEASVELLLVGMLWWLQPPLTNFGPGLHYSCVESLLAANGPDYGKKSLPNIGDRNTGKALAAACDDFRELGVAYLREFYGAAGPLRR